MVQVDVFWSYGIGAGFAVASARQLEAVAQEKKSALDHRSFRDAVLYLSCLFAPSGAFLLWQFPSWETMHVGDRDLPGWLASAFAMTNVTQGILGFWVADLLLRRGQRYLAYLQWVAGYFAMFFILVHGWDGTGYQRFFSPTRGDLAGWTWATAGTWLTCDVALSLMAMGPFILPLMLGPMGRALKRGYALGQEVSPELAARRGARTLAVSFALAALTLVLGAAVVASLAIRGLGPWLGVPAFAALAYVVWLRPGGLLHRHFRFVVFAAPLFGSAQRRTLQREVA